MGMEELRRKMSKSQIAVNKSLLLRT